jgi:hypothetical protein
MKTSLMPTANATMNMMNMETRNQAVTNHNCSRVKKARVTNNVDKPL